VITRIDNWDNKRKELIYQHDNNQSAGGSVVSTACRIMQPLVEVIAYTLPNNFAVHFFISILLRPAIKHNSLCEELGMLRDCLIFKNNVYSTCSMLTILKNQTSKVTSTLPVFFRRFFTQ